MKPAKLTINLRNLRHNWRILNEQSQNMCGAAVKANAYGLGVKEVVKALYSEGCKHFFVAYLEEALEIKPLAPDAEIFLLNGYNVADVPTYIQQNFTPIISVEEDFLSLIPLSQKPIFALHFDTGMNRLGLNKGTAEKIANLCYDHGLNPRLIMSHFISSEERDNPTNNAQLKNFRDIIQSFPNTLHSLSNSSGIFLDTENHFHLTRPGYALYGGNPTLYKDQNPMKPVINLSAPIIQIKTIKKGESVGYNSTWTAQRDSVISTLSYGYADGLHRLASNKAHAYIGEYKAPFVGNISMDLTCLDVTDIPTEVLQKSNYAEIIGSNQSIESLAKDIGTIGYEILTSLGSRLNKTYQK